MKRAHGTLDSFIQRTRAPKKPKYDLPGTTTSHPAYPFPIPHFPAEITSELAHCPAQPGKAIKENDLDIIYHNPYIPASIADTIFDFLRSELPFHRVSYKISRPGGVETTINTPRYTTVFGVDSTSRFAPSTNSAALTLIDTKTNLPIEKARYKCTPRPLPQPLSALLAITEATTGHTFNFALVNYYADGNDSITYHSDDERFLGADPAIASFSFGAKRDFLLKHKTRKDVAVRKFELGSGDMLLMGGSTQKCWLHSIPKRAGAEAGRGRINITFRKALVKGGTENYYRYNVGDGGVWKWDDAVGKMAPRTAEKGTGELVSNRMPM
jgi:alkylated DNA repair dioxygenase AlkB